MNATVECYDKGNLISTNAFASVSHARAYARIMEALMGWHTLTIY